MTASEYFDVFRYPGLLEEMPYHIKYCLELNGDPAAAGFWVSDLKHWLNTSLTPVVSKWRDELKRHTKQAYKHAEKRQRKMNDTATEYYGKQNGLIRNRGVIDPVLMAFNRKCFKDPEAMRDTRKKEPKLFIT